MATLTADGVGTMEIMERTGQSKPTVWRWQARFAEAGVDGLLRDKTRPPGKKPLPEATVRQVVTRTTTGRPTDATHWSARAMAKAVGIADSSVQKIWPAHGLKPHQVRAKSERPSLLPTGIGRAGRLPQTRTYGLVSSHQFRADEALEAFYHLIVP